MKHPLQRAALYVVLLLVLSGFAHLVIRSTTSRKNEPPIIHANGDVTNVALMQMAQVNGLLSGDVPDNDLERERRRQYEDALRQMILNRYGGGPFRIVLATNGTQQLVLDFPAMTYRLTKY